MLERKKIFIVIPAYNVEDHISDVLRAIPPFVDRMIVVDDASMDKTSEEVSKINDQRIVLLTHKENQGVGGATITGIQFAVENGADVVVKMDGDNQMDPHYLKELVTPIIKGTCEYVKGNRFLHSRELAAMPKIRLIGNFVLTFLTKLVSGYWNVFDPQNGYIALKADVVQQLDLSKISRRYFFENDMLIHMNILGVRVRELAMPARYAEERSSMRIGTIMVTFPFYLTKRYWYRMYQKYVLREFSPIAVFVYTGVPLISWGILFGAYTWARSVILERVSTTGTVMLSVLPLILGFELVLQAIVLEIQESKK